MTPKQTRFVEEYLIDLNATQAYIRAGYSPNGAKQSAARMLTNADIRDAITEKQQEVAERAGLSVDWVVERLNRIVALSMQERPQISLDGEPTGRTLLQNANQARQTLIKLGEHIGMWPTKVTVYTPDLMQEAQRLADELGLSVDDVLKEAESVIAEAK